MEATTGASKWPTQFSVPWPDMGAHLLAILDRYAASLLFSDDDVTLTAKDIKFALSSLTHELQNSVPLGGRVGICFQNSAAQALAILATLAAARVPVILNPSRLSEKSGANLKSMNLGALLGPRYLPRDLVTSLQIPIFLLDTNGLINWKNDDYEHPERALPRTGTGLILYTSGSTGNPKGVEIPMSGLQYTIATLIEYFQLSTKSRAIVCLPMYHTMALNTQFFPTFFAGGHCHFTSSEFCLGHVYRDIVSTKATFVALVSDMLRLLAHEQERRQVAPASAVEDVQLAGGTIRPEHLALAQALFPKATIHKGYGLTEAMRITMLSSDNPHFMTDVIGRSLPGQQLAVCDAAGKPLPSGQLGEIYVSGPNVMLGYDGTSESPLVSGYLPTGDFGTLSAAGYLSINGRKDDTFKSQGRRIAGWEIENIALTDPNVAFAKCIPITCEQTGFRPLLFIEPVPGAATYFQNEGKYVFEALLKHALHTYKRPKDVFVLPLLPRSANGKIQRPTLEHFWQMQHLAPVIGFGKCGLRFLGAPLIPTIGAAQQ